MKRFLIFLAVAAAFSFSAYAQDEKGYVTGSLESNNYYYLKDPETGAVVGDNPFGSNNYLKLDYYKGRFSAGIQMEGYLPAAEGYPGELKGFNLNNIYVKRQDESFSVTAGTFYEQFGSGLLFRAWEDRSLGLNNAVLGARFTYEYKDIVSFKALWGVPRMGMGVFFSGAAPKTDPVTNQVTQVRGADLSLALSNLLAWNNTYLAIEGSVLNRFEPVAIDLIEIGGDHHTTGWSGRLNFESSGFFAKVEYVDSGEKYLTDNNAEVGYSIKNGNAQLLEFGYNGKGLGVTATARRLEWMGSKIINRYTETSSSNLMNYVPAMCTQYTYLLTTFHPYVAQLGDQTTLHFNSGEMGGQIDAFYNFRRGTALGGKRGMKIHANFSTYYTLAEEGTYTPGNMLFRDFSFDVEKQWTRKFKMVLLYSLQQYNESYGANSDYMTQNIFVADLLYKWTSLFSTRLELQYLFTEQDKKDWMAALLEVNFAPKWSIFASDMYNHGSTGHHYYNVGVSYAKSRTRVALGYGRYKSGFICSGGVCRPIKAYTGPNFSVTTSF